MRSHSSLSMWIRAIDLKQDSESLHSSKGRFLDEIVRNWFTNLEAGRLVRPVFFSETSAIDV